MNDYGLCNKRERKRKRKRNKGYFKLLSRLMGAQQPRSKALLERENINKKQKIPGSPPGTAIFKKTLLEAYFDKQASTALLGGNAGPGLQGIQGAPKNFVIFGIFLSIFDE